MGVAETEALRGCMLEQTGKSVRCCFSVLIHGSSVEAVACQKLK